MGFMDDFKREASKLKDTATRAVDKNSDAIKGGLDKAGELVDKQTKGRYTDKIDTAKSKAKQGLDSLDGKKDDFPDTDKS